MTPAQSVPPGLGLRPISPDEPDPGDIPTSVVIMYPTSGQMSVFTHVALGDLHTHERRLAEQHDRPTRLLGEKALRSGANINQARNDLIRWWLDDTTAEWAFLLDCDMQPQPDVLDRLLKNAARVDATVVGGLCCMVDATDGPQPTIYSLVPNPAPGALTQRLMDWPEGHLVQVTATGAACLLVHRTAAQAVRDQQPGVRFPWFTENEINQEWVSEDISFCLKAAQAGHPVWVDCTTHVGHDKGLRVWWPQDVKKEVGFPAHRTFVCIPFKDRWDLTGPLVDQLVEQGGWSDLILCDNGSGPDTVAALEELAQVWPDKAAGEERRLHTLTMPDVGIHDMWNAAVEILARCGQHRNTQVVFLNNDVTLGDDFCRRLVGALRSHRPAAGERAQLVAVSANYDGRSFDGALQPTADICAGRYDGTGGLAGFAFAVRGEWFFKGYRFPTEMKWWCGDNHLVTSIVRDGHWCAIARDATVAVVDGGSQTVNERQETDPEFAAQLQRDLEAWHRWIADNDGPQTLSLNQLYERLCAEPSDIRAHLPRLHQIVLDTDAEAVIELGVRSGRSTIAFLHALEQTGGHLWSVDLDESPVTHPRMTFIQGDDTSARTLAQLPDQADVVFVDSDHTVQLTRREIALYAPRVKPGGCICFHDSNERAFPHHQADGYLPQPDFPVRVAINEWLATLEGHEVDSWTDDHGFTVVWPHGRPAVAAIATAADETEAVA